MPSFKLDGREIPFEPGDSIIRAAWKQGIEVPHYCWHPGLSSPANCRMCLVEIKPPEGQRGIQLDIVAWDEEAQAYRTVKKPKLLPSCQMQAVDGQEVLAETSPHVIQARSYVQEALLLNHPVDCPICDQAGECKLQDYWLAHQGTKKRMREEPVHKPKGVQFGESIVYDGERCVMCTRCVRFMEEVAKDPVLEMRERGNLNEISVAPGRKLEGNYTLMVEHVCPVGALTSTDFRFKARVWFLRSAKTICQGCAQGCNAHLDFDPRYNKAYRYRARDNHAVNSYWMCDPGMLSYKAVHENRLLEATVNGKHASTHAAIEAAKGLLAGASGVAIVHGRQQSQEDNVALAALGEALGAKVFVTGAADGFADDILIKADKNSNTAGVALLAPKAGDFAALRKAVSKGDISAVLVLGTSVPSDDDGAISDLRGAKTIALAVHEGPIAKAATVVLPIAAWAECSGTFVNIGGHAQVSEKALEPQGSARPGWEVIAKLGAALGHDLGFAKLKEVRARLASATPAVSTAPEDSAPEASA